MPDPVHCEEPMEMARLIPRFQALPELLVFRCSHCGHVETMEQPISTRAPAVTQRSRRVKKGPEGPEKIPKKSGTPGSPKSVPIRARGGLR